MQYESTYILLRVVASKNMCAITPVINKDRPIYIQDLISGNFLLPDNFIPIQEIGRPIIVIAKPTIISSSRKLGILNIFTNIRNNNSNLNHKF